VLDVLVDASGRVARVGPSLSVAPDVPVVDGQGAYLSRGWIDLHTHVYYGATDISVRPAQAGMATGVTTLVDTGSAGEANFHGFREYIVDAAAEQVFAFLNIGSIGLVATNRVSELIDMRSIDFDRSLAVIERNRDVIKGVKIRASHVITGSWGITPVKVAKKLSRAVGLPLMVHVGESPPVLDEVLTALDAGDIVTHCFNGKPGGNVLDDEQVFEAAREAQRRGVLFDVGHGSASFSFDVAERALARGMELHSISTDLHAHNIDGPVVDLATTMSKLLAIGVPLEAVVSAVTTAPAKALGLRQEAWLEPGSIADFTLFDVQEVDLPVRDSRGAERRLDRFLRPRYAARGARIVAAGSRSLAGAGAR
jgi:dihydroorotase